MTPTEQDCFFRFKMRIVPLNIMVFIARNEYKGIK